METKLLMVAGRLFACRFGRACHCKRFSPSSFFAHVVSHRILLTKHRHTLKHIHDGAHESAIARLGRHSAGSICLFTLPLTMISSRRTMSRTVRSPPVSLEFGSEPPGQRLRGHFTHTRRPFWWHSIPNHKPETLWVCGIDLFLRNLMQQAKNHLV